MSAQSVNQLTLIKITGQDRKRIIDIFADNDVRCYNDFSDDDSDYCVDYFVFGLEDDTDDVFYDHTVEFDKIFKELGCVCMGFQFNNDFYEKGQINTHYGMWFSKVQTPEQGVGQ